MATIRGTYYEVITQDELDEELYHIAVRAINTFKFPHVSLDYKTFYAVRSNDDPNELIEVDENLVGSVPHGYFVNKITDKEIAVLLAWMKVYWIEEFMSSSDDFENVYTDSNLKTFSRANLIQQNETRYKDYVLRARETETNYSRTTNYTPTLGGINSDEG